VCFIGGNGTGKSTLLRFLDNFTRRRLSFDDFGTAIIKIDSSISDKEVYACLLRGGMAFLHESIDENINWQQYLNDKIRIEYAKGPVGDYREYALMKTNYLHDIQLSIFSPAESSTNLGVQISDVPNTQLNDAMPYFQKFPTHHTISPNTIKDYWNLLIFLVKKRENDLREFEEKEENLDKTIREVRKEFDKNNPDILQEIAKSRIRI